MIERTGHVAGTAKKVAKRSSPPKTPAVGTLFLISQIGEKGSSERRRADEVHEHIVVPVATKHGLVVARSDLDPTPGQLTTQIIKGIIGAQVVVADLTGRNPNVYFELGVAQSFAKPLVLLVKDAASLPFDVKNERTIVIGDGDVLGVSDAKEAAGHLDSSLSVVLADDYEPSNLVTEVAAARSLDLLAPTNPVASEVSATREAIEEVSMQVRLILRRLPSTARRADLRSLTRFVEHQVEENRPLRRDLLDMINDETSSEFDKWVHEVLDRLVEVEREAGLIDPDEEPF